MSTHHGDGDIRPSRDRDQIEDPPVLSEANSALRAGLSHWQVVLLWAGILMVAAAVRMTSWSEVFSPDGVRFLADTDPHYHVLRALRIVENFPRIPWTDPAMNHPLGAVILWPPLFDLLIAIPAQLLGGSTAIVELVAVWIPVVLGLATLLLVGALGKAIADRQVGIIAAALLAVLPASMQYTILGRPDQHAMELVASCWVFLAFINTWRIGPTWTSATIFGLGIAAAFWNWQGSGFYLVLLVGFTALWHLIALGERQGPHPARALAQGSTVGTLVLGLSVALSTPEGFRATHIMGVTAFHVILVGVTASFAWLLLFFIRKRRGAASLWRRLVEIAVSGLVPVLVALKVVPGFQESVERGLAALTAANAWYAVIHEFSPLLFGGTSPVTVEMASIFHHFGLLLVVAPLCVPSLVKRWRRQSEPRPEMLFLLYWGSLLMILTFLRVRFNLYAIIPLALWLAVALEELGEWIRGRSTLWGSTLGFVAPALAAILVLLPAISFLKPGTFREAPLVTMGVPLLRWLRDVPAPMPGREGVLTPWSLGHAVLYFSRKPVVTTPFGTDGGLGAMEDSAQFFLASNPDGAEFLLGQRQIGFLLLLNPADEVLTLYPFFGSTAPSPVTFVPDRLNGGEMRVTNTFGSLVVSRLYFQDGSGAARFRSPALASYRLLFETPSVRGPSSLSERQMKLFGVVRGANVVVEHARPESLVVATVPVVTNQGRPFLWTTVAQSDAMGRATVRIPYATGKNGLVGALACTVSDGVRSAEIALLEKQIAEGENVVADLLVTGNLARPAPAPGVRR